MGIKELAPRPIAKETGYIPESIDVYHVCSNAEKAEKQVPFMRSWTLNESTGRYELVLTERPHVFDTELPETVHQLLPHGRAAVFLAHHEHTEFNWGEDNIVGKPFLALHWMSRVDKEGHAEELIFRLSGFSQEQAQSLLRSFLQKKETQPKDEGDNLISFNEDLDPLGYPNPFLVESAQNIFSHENPVRNLIAVDAKNEFLKQMTNLALMRYLTHNPQINNYELKPKFVIDENGKGCVIAFDRIMGRWGRLDSSTTNSKIINNWRIVQDGLQKYYNDPNHYKPDFSARMPIALSARTAGLRPGNKWAADQELKAKPNGEISLPTNIVPADTVPPELFNTPEISYLPPIETPFILHRSTTPLPILPGGSQFILPGGGGFVLPSYIPNHHNKMSRITPSASTYILGLTMMAPMVFTLDQTFANFAIASVVLSPEEFVYPPLSAKEEVDTVTYEEIEELDQLSTIPTTNPDEAADEEIYQPFSDEPEPGPIFDGGGDRGGGGGRLLPQKIATIFDLKMAERFKEATQNQIQEVESALPKEQIIFSAAKTDAKNEIKFKEYASDLEVIIVEPNIDVLAVEQKNTKQLLLANSTQETTKDANCDKTVLEQGFVTQDKKDIETEDETTQPFHYDTVQYHSEKKEEPPLLRHSGKSRRTSGRIQNQKEKDLSETPSLPNDLIAEYIFLRHILNNQAQSIVPGIKTPESNFGQGENDRFWSSQNDEGQVVNKKDTFVSRIEKNKSNTKKLKLKTKIKTNIAFLSLLLLTKIKLLTKVKTILQKGNRTKLQELFATDTLLLFLLNPKLFLVAPS